MKGNNNSYRGAAAVLLCLLIAASSCVTYAATTTISKNNVYYEENGSSRVKISCFEVKGKPAFCVERGKTGPSTGTEAVPEVYTDTDLDKILYYGFSGPEQWEGFSSDKEARSCTTVMVSYAHFKHDPFDWIDGYSEYEEFLKTAEAPDVTLSLNRKELAAEFDEDWEYQRTPAIEVKGSPKGALRLELPEGVELVYVGSGKSCTKSAVLAAGDQFYLRTCDESVNGSLMTLRGYNRKVEVTRYVTKSDSVQDLVQLNLPEDKENPVELTVKWAEPKTVNIIINKKGASYSLKDGRIERSEAALAGATFKITGDFGTSVKLVTDASGKACAEGLKPGCYSVSELSAPEGYIADGRVYDLDLNIGADRSHLDYNLNLVNEQATGRLTIIKCDNVTGAKLSGATFRVTNESGESIEAATDATGCVQLTHLPLGRYEIEETVAPKGYRLDSAAQEVEISAASAGTRIRTVTFFDAPDKSAPPETGDGDGWIGYVMALALCSAALLLLTVLRRCGKL